MEISLETKYAGLNLKNPLIIGSSGLTNSVDKNKNLEKAGAGAIVLKSLFEEQISMQSGWMLQNTDYPEANDYIMGYVKSGQVTDYLNLIQETKRNCEIPVIASINCYKVDTWIDFAHQIEMAGADALELNIFIIQTELEFDNSESQDEYIKILNRVKEVVNIPVIVKIGRYFDNVPSLVNKLYVNGASAVVLFNRFYQPDIDINKLQILSGQVFSSHSDIADTLRWTGIVSGKIPHISLAASTGIHDWEDVVKCILAGSSAVQLCSTVYQHGLEIIGQINRSMEEWMNSMNFSAIEDFKGKLNYSKINNPALYERAQFMKYFSNRD